MKSYIKNLRSKIGHDKFIHPGARIIVENKLQEILVIERIDNGKLGLPAGGLEENETIEECIVREVREETGLKIISLQVIGISSDPIAESVVYPNGDKIQYFTVEFYSNEWEGKIQVRDKNEVKNAKFVNVAMLEKLPSNELATLSSLKYFREHGRINLK